MRKIKRKTMAPRTRSFDSGRTRRPSAAETSTSVDISSSVIAEKVPGTVTGEIPFTANEEPAITLRRELRERSTAILRAGVCLGGDPAITIDPESISQITASPEGAQVIVDALARGVVAEALVLEVGDAMAGERQQAAHLAGRIVDLKDDMAAQGLEMEALRRKRREDTPATGLTAGSSTTITRKKKSLEHPKRLSDGKDPSFEFWQRAIRHKITVDEHETPTAAEQVDYIISRCEGKAAAHLEADLRKGTFDNDPLRLLNFLKDLFDDPHRQDRALGQFQRLTMRDGEKYSDFYLRFRKLAADAELPESLLKAELNQKITPELQFGAAAEITRPGSTFQEFQAAVSRLAFAREGILARQKARTAPAQRLPRGRANAEQGNTNRPTTPQAQGPPAGNVTAPNRGIVKCYNCQANGHIARNCPNPKRARVLAAETPPEDGDRVVELTSNGEAEN